MAAALNLALDNESVTLVEGLRIRVRLCDEEDVPPTGRQAREDHRFGEFHVPKDSIVLCAQWVMHKDERYYSEPQKFIPERWTPEAKASRPKFSYFPFSAGPRQCIGESFAWMEGVLLLAIFAQRWKLRLEPGHRIVPLPAITLRPKTGVMVRVERR